MPGNARRRGQGVELDRAPNPPLDIPWLDPKKKYSFETMSIGFKRFYRLTIKNYATIPLIITGMAKLSFAEWFSLHRLRTTADVFTPHGDQEPWHQFEHKHSKLNSVDMGPILREHPRPKFDYQCERRQLEFKWFPLSAQYFWPSQREPPTQRSEVPKLKLEAKLSDDSKNHPKGNPRSDPKGKPKNDPKNDSKSDPKGNPKKSDRHPIK